MNFHRINKHDIANGEGIRVSLFVSGCQRHCPGCFNSETWDPDSGKVFTDNEVEEILKACEPDYIAGLSLLGGEPFEGYNQPELVRLVKAFKERYPRKDIWCWTGFTYESLAKNNSELLSLLDVLVDGEFKQDKKDLRLKWRGSSNQRVINVKNSLWYNKVVPY